MRNSIYSSKDILQVLNDFYNYQAAFDPEVDKGEKLTFETTISEWRNICDLMEYKGLAKYYHNLFELNTPFSDIENLIAQGKNKLEIFCEYLAAHTTKQNILPVKVMGQNCITTSIFKVLIKNLKVRGVDTKDIRPSTELIPLFDKFGVILLEEVNKLVPGSFSKFEYRDNRVVRAGIIINLFSFLFYYLL